MDGKGVSLRRKLDKVLGEVFYCICELCVNYDNLCESVPCVCYKQMKPALFEEGI